MKLTYGPDYCGGQRDLFLDGELCASAVLSSDAIQIVETLDRYQAEVERYRAELGAIKERNESCTAHLVHDEFTPCPVHDVRLHETHSRASHTDRSESRVDDMQPVLSSDALCHIRCLDDRNSHYFLQAGNIYEARVSGKYFEIIRGPVFDDSTCDDSSSALRSSPWKHSQWLRERFEVVMMVKLESE